MATEAEKVAASQGRQRIPLEWQMEFQSWTDDALLSLSEDDKVADSVRFKGKNGEWEYRNVKAYAGWELDYRIAFNEPRKKQPQLVIADDERALTKLLKARKKGERA